VLLLRTITLVAEAGSIMAERHTSILKPFVTGDVTEWFQRFEICYTANTWNDDVKVVKLSMLLEGEALAVWLELSDEDKKECKGAPIKECDAHSLDEFHQQKLQPGESLFVFLRNCLVGLCQGLWQMHVSSFCFISCWRACLGNKHANTCLW